MVNGVSTWPSCLASLVFPFWLLLITSDYLMAPFVCFVFFIYFGVWYKWKSLSNRLTRKTSFKLRKMVSLFLFLKIIFRLWTFPSSSSSVHSLSPPEVIDNHQRSSSEVTDLCHWSSLAATIGVPRPSPPLSSLIFRTN